MIISSISMNSYWRLVIVIILLVVLIIANCGSVEALTRQKATDGTTDYLLRTPENPSSIKFLILAYGTQQQLRQLITFAHIIEDYGHVGVISTQR
jgi:hypothetical protein